MTIGSGNLGKGRHVSDVFGSGNPGGVVTDPRVRTGKIVKVCAGSIFHNSFVRLSRIICAFLLRTLIFYIFG